MRETFLLAFLLGAAAIAAWIAVRLPRLAPQSMRSAGAHVAVAMLVGLVLAPALRLVPGQPSETAVLIALFAVALPALTYMLLAGIWLLKLFAGDQLARR